MLGVPLAIYVEKDVDDRDILVDLINVRRVASFSVYFTLGPLFPILHPLYPFWYSVVAIQSSSFPFQKHGGTVSPGYSGVTYILGINLKYAPSCHRCLTFSS